MEFIINGTPKIWPTCGGGTLTVGTAGMIRNGHLGSRIGWRNKNQEYCGFKVGCLLYFLVSIRSLKNYTPSPPRSSVSLSHPFPSRSVPSLSFTGTDSVTLVYSVTRQPFYHFFLPDFPISPSLPSTTCQSHPFHRFACTGRPFFFWCN